MKAVFAPVLIATGFGARGGGYGQRDGPPANQLGS